MRWGTLLRLGLLAMLAACQPDRGDDDALVDEMQAVRAAVEQLNLHLMRRTPTGQEGDAASAPVVREALQPLGEVIDEILAGQAETRADQQALTAELQRWSTLVAVPDGRQAELAELRSRLEQLEQKLQTQDARHREIQDLLLRAMESTAGRLEQFLESVSAPPPAVPEPQPGAGKIGEPKAEPSTGDGGGGTASVGRAPPGLSRAFADPVTPWVLLGGVLLLGLFAWRLRSARGAATPVEPDGPEPAPDETPWSVVEALAAWQSYLDRHPGADDVAGRLEPEPEREIEPDVWESLLAESADGEPEPAVQPGAVAGPKNGDAPDLQVSSGDVWQQVLAEAKANEPQSEPELAADGCGAVVESESAASSTAAPAEVNEPVGAVHGAEAEPLEAHDPLAALAAEVAAVAAAADVEPTTVDAVPDGDRDVASAVAVPVTAEPGVNRPGAQSSPPSVSILADSASAIGSQRLTEYLDADPRVLRRPAPRVSVRGEAVSAEFWVLPHLPEGEREQLRSRAIEELRATTARVGS